MAVKTHRSATQKVAATKTRTFRSFLLMAQFEAKEIGQRIAEARTLAGLTQEDLAEMASFSKRSLQDYETGVTIPYRHMREISRLLGREVEWFLNGDPPADPHDHPGEPGVMDVLERLEARLSTVEELLTELLRSRSGRSAGSAGPKKRRAS